MQIPSIADSFPSNKNNNKGNIWVDVDAEYKIACERQDYWREQTERLWRILDGTMAIHLQMKRLKKYLIKKFLFKKNMCV